MSLVPFAREQLGSALHIYSTLRTVACTSWLPVCSNTFRGLRAPTSHGHCVMTMWTHFPWSVCPDYLWILISLGMCVLTICMSRLLMASVPCLLACPEFPWPVCPDCLYVLTSRGLCVLTISMSRPRGLCVLTAWASWLPVSRVSWLPKSPDFPRGGLYVLAYLSWLHVACTYVLTACMSRLPVACVSRLPMAFVSWLSLCPLFVWPMCPDCWWTTYLICIFFIQGLLPYHYQQKTISLPILYVCRIATSDPKEEGW